MKYPIYYYAATAMGTPRIFCGDTIEADNMQEATEQAQDRAKGARGRVCLLVVDGAVVRVTAPSTFDKHFDYSSRQPSTSEKKTLEALENDLANGKGGKEYGST